MSREVGGRAVGTSKGPRDQDGETISRAARVFLVRRGMGLGRCWFLASVDGFERVIGDWGLGIGDGRARPGVQSTWRMDSGQRTAASSVSNRGRGALDLGGEGALGAGHPMGRAGQRVFNAMAVDEPGNATIKKTSTRKSHAFRQTVRNHNHDRNTPSPYHVLFSCWRIGDGITALQPLEEEDGGRLSPPAPPPRGPPPLLFLSCSSSRPASRQDPSTIALLHHPNASVCNLREG